MKIYTTISASLLFLNIAVYAHNCYPPINPQQAQIIVGYGSLMNEASKKRSDPNVSDSYPVRVTGFKRGWLARSCNKIIGFSTTFLNIYPEKNSTMNAVIYKLGTAHNIYKYDARENIYCRIRIPSSHIKFLVPIPKTMRHAQIWIYANKKKDANPPSKNCPIVQSYVDVFLTGCLNIQKKFNLPNFAKQCIMTTSHWSPYWVNDRIYPRRPFIYQPNAREIDKLLEKTHPKLFDAIKIE